MKRSAFLLAVILMTYSGIVFGQNPFPETFQRLEVNNVSAGFCTNGAFFWNGEYSPFTGFKVPKTDTVGTILAGGLWMGGIDAGNQLKLAAQTYNQAGRDFWPGAYSYENDTTYFIDSLTLDTFAFPPHFYLDSAAVHDWDTIWRMTRYQVEQHIAKVNQSLPLFLPIASIDRAILEWPAKGNLWAKGKGGVQLIITKPAAPFFDFDGDGLYDPRIDHPDIKGDEMLWYVFNDRTDIHTESGGQPIGMEIQVSAYQYNCPADHVLNNTLFVEYKTIYKGSITINNFHIGKWVDFTIACSSLDYVGCDTLSNTFYSHQKIPDFSCPLSYTPLQTITFLDQTMSGHRFYGNNASVTGNPEAAVHFYNYLSGFWKDGTQLTYGGTGYGGTTPIKYAVPGNPSDTAGWSQCAEGHIPTGRRSIGIIGPFTLTPDTVITMTLAYTTHFLPGFFPCPDFTPYRQRIDSLKFKFDNNLLAGCETYHFTCDDPDSTGFTCVWPGDASDDGISNMQDIFPIGIAYGDSFATRPNASTNWIGQPMQDWPLNFTLIGGNHKHADCNGDAVIDSFDFQPILDNYGLVHFKGGPSNKAGLPLTLEVQQGPFTAGSTVSVDVLLGTQTEQVPDFYAMAFSVAYNKDVVQPGSITIDLGNSWAGTRGVDFMGIRKELSAQGRVDIGVTRIDHANRAGFGRIATINYILIDDIAGKDAFELATLSPWIVEAKAIRNDETEISLFLSVDETPEQHVSIYPNPAGNLLNVVIPASQQAEWVRIYDSVGKEFFKTRYSGERLTISTEDFAEGIYFVEVSGSKTRSTYKVAILR